MAGNVEIPLVQNQLVCAADGLIRNEDAGGALRAGDRMDDGDSVAVITLDYLVQTDAGPPIALSTNNLRSIRRRTEAHGRNLQISLDRMQAERHKLKSWVNSSVPVPYLTLKRGEARIVALNVAIPATSQQLAILKSRLKAVRELIELADTLNGSRLKIAEVDAIQHSTRH